MRFKVKGIKGNAEYKAKKEYKASDKRGSIKYKA